MRRNALRQLDRCGAAAVELALLLPLLFTFACGALDFARVYYFTQIVTDCARTGAMYAANPDAADETEFNDVEQATLTAATGLSPTPSVTVSRGSDVVGNQFVSVNVRYSFSLITGYLGIPSPVTISRTVHARYYPSAELN